MLILFIHPNYHSWRGDRRKRPPACVAYLSGASKKAGYSNVKFIDAMTFDVGDEALGREAAIARHAWTFSEGDEFTYRFSPELTPQLKGSPICKGIRRQGPVCGYFAATFERIFGAILGSSLRVTETECEATGASTDVFEIHWWLFANSPE